MPQMTKLAKANTKIRHEDGETIIRLYNTDVVRFNHQRVVLDSGGHKTATTKTRMNQAASQYNLPYKVWCRKGAWCVTIYNPVMNVDLDFYDGIWIDLEDNEENNDHD